MVAPGRLGHILIGLFAQIYISATYESGTLCMYQAMTFYESFGLEVAYKIIKRRLGSRVYVFTNLTQVWHDDEAIRYYDQIFMLILGRTTKMYNLFEKLEQVNFQTGFELIAEQIIDGNEPYLDWASRYVPAYDTANETTVAENMFLPDTAEAFTFRENFINKKYGTLPPNHTIFAGLDLESNSNNSLQRALHLDINPYKELLDRIRKGERFPPDATFPGMEMEKDDNLRAISEEEEIPIREKLDLIKEQKMHETRRKVRMRARRYNAAYTQQMYEKDVPPRYYEQRAREMYQRDQPTYDDRNENDLYDREEDPTYYEQNAQYPDRRFEHVQETNVARNSYKDGQPSNRANKKKSSQKRSIMDVIRNLIYSNTDTDIDDQVTNVNKASFARKGRKVRKNMDAREGTVLYQPYEIMREEDDIDEMARNPDQRNAINHYIYVHHADNRNVDNDRAVRNERKTARDRRSRFKKNERRAAKARQTIRANARKVYGMENVHNQRQMNYAHEANYRENVRSYGKYNNFESRAANTYRKNEPMLHRESVNVHDNLNVQNKPMGIHKGDDHINNYYAPAGPHPRAENNFAHFHQINEVDRFNKLSHLHEISKAQNHPDKAAHVDLRQENKNLPILHVEQIEERGHFPHEARHIIKSQNKQKNIARFYPHNQAFQHINRLPAVRVDHQNIAGHQYQSFQARPVFINRNNLPVLHQVANKQPFGMIHNAAGIIDVNPFQNAKQSRKVKSAPRSRKSNKKSAYNRPKAFNARKSKITTSFHQYNVDIEGHNTLHVIDVLQYHYEPKGKIQMVQ